MTTVALDCPPRWGTPRTPSRKTYGPVAIRVAKLLGVRPLPWQERVLMTALEVDDTGRFCYPECTLLVGRQNGKSLLVTILWVTRCLLWPDQQVTLSAQTAQDCRKAWSERAVPMLERSPLGPFIKVRHQNGSESITWANGSKQSITATTERAGHGQSLDGVYLDEVFSFQDSRLETALRPTLLTRPNPSFWTTSTAGTPHGSPYLLEKLERGRAAVEANLDHGLAYWEWSAPDHLPIDDPATWALAMPAMGHLIDEKSIRASMDTMSARSFARSMCNRWVSSMGDPVLPAELWESLADPDAPRPGHVILAVDVAPSSKSAAIAAAGMVDNELHVSVLEHGPGTEWVTSAVERLVHDLGASEVVYDDRTTAPLLTGLDVPCRVTETSATDMAAGCLFLVDIARNRRLRHRGESELAIALDSAGQRSLGDGWAWSRKNSGGVDITPLVAVTLAAWGFHGGWDA